MIGGRCVVGVDGGVALVEEYAAKDDFAELGFVDFDVGV